MKGLTFTGILLLAVSAFLFYLNTDFQPEKFTISHLMGILGGIGIGLILGGLIGYISKGSAIRSQAKLRELEQLRKEKLEIEKEKSRLAKNENGATGRIFNDRL